MAKFPRSKRKMFQIDKVKYQSGNYAVRQYYNDMKAIFIIGFFKSKKKARQFIANKRRAIRSREW